MDVPMVVMSKRIGFPIPKLTILMAINHQSVWVVYDIAVLTLVAQVSPPFPQHRDAVHRALRCQAARDLAGAIVVQAIKHLPQLSQHLQGRSRVGSRVWGFFL